MISGRKRLVCLALFLFSLFGLLVAQFYTIQVQEGDKWAREATKQHFFVVKEPFLRGSFYSNTAIKQDHPEIPQKLVTDILTFHLHIDPESIPQEFKKTIFLELMALLNVPQEEKKQFITHFLLKSRDRKLAMWLDKDTRDQISNWWLSYAKNHRIPRNALFFTHDYQRSYPFGKLLGQVLQTVQNLKDEKTGQAIPTGGLELYFNQYLKGKEGKRRLMRSPRHSLELGEVIASPENGADIYLTINHYLQAIAEEELARGVQNCKAKSGWAILLEPRTGEILALAHYPFFNPSEYQTYYADPKRIDDARIKAVVDANEPGSVMKPITVAIALKANQELKALGKAPLFDPEEKMATSDCRFPGRKPLKDLHMHSFLNMNMAIRKSSNIYVARLIDKVIQQMGNNWYKRALHDTFGFGEKTGIELPSEGIGLVPTPGKKHPNGALEWSVPTPYSLAMGHNIQASSLQIARAFAIFANGGFLVQPTLIKKIVKTHSDGSEEILLDHTKPDRILRFPRVLNEDIARRVTTALKYSTKPGGTCRRADVPGYTEAGKSGTAQKVINGVYSNILYCSTFVGFTPVNHPAFVIVVTMDEPEYGFVPGLGKNHHGGTCATPVFREIAKRVLEYLGIPPDDPYGYPVGDPRYDPNKADWAKETRQLQEMYEKWNNHDLSDKQKRNEIKKTY